MSSPAADRAAILVVFRHGEKGREVLVMRRKEHDADPWSGQISFPGGHAHPADGSLLVTALREASEEVNLSRDSLAAEPTFVGERSPGNRLDLRVSVYVVNARDGIDLHLHPGPEASEIHWLPIDGLRPVTRRVTLPRRGFDLEVEGYDSGPLFIWGLTYRVLSDLLTKGKVGDG